MHERSMGKRHIKYQDRIKVILASAVYFMRQIVVAHLIKYEGMAM